VKVFEQAIAIEEAAEHDDDPHYRMEETKLIVENLTDEQSANRVVGQIAEFISSPLALFRRKHNE